MDTDLAAANVNRSYSLAATSIAIFTFVLFFLYPKYAAGEVNDLLFQATLIVMGLSTFSFTFSSFYYYSASLAGRFDDAERAQSSRLGDRFWLLGYVLLFLAPSVILLSIHVVIVATVWFGLWLVFVAFVIYRFPRFKGAGVASPG